MVAAMFQEALGEEYNCISAGTSVTPFFKFVLPHTQEAIKELGIGEIEDGKRTRELETRMVNGADVVFCLGKAIHEKVLNEFCEFEESKKKVHLFAPDMDKFYDPYDLDGFSQEEIQEKNLQKGEIESYIEVAKKIRDIFIPQILAEYFPERLEAWEKRIGKENSTPTGSIRESTLAGGLVATIDSNQRKV